MKKNPHLPGTADEFIEANMDLAHSIAWRFVSVTHQGILDMDDIFSVAYYGLVKAYQGFDPTVTQGKNGEQVKFSTYAVPLIKGYIMTYIRDHNGALKIKRGDKETLAKIEQSGFTGKEPPEVISAELNIPLSAVRNALIAILAMNVDSIERKFGVSESEEVSVVSLIGTYDEDICDKIMLDNFVNGLSSNLRDVYRYRYLMGLSQAETAKTAGCSQAQVSRLEKRLLKAARDYGQREQIGA